MKKIQQLFGLDLRSLALFRMGLALIIITDLIIRFQDLNVFYTDQGVLPRSALISEGILNPLYWSIYFINGQPLIVGMLFIFAIFMAFCMLIGYRTRLATIASWAMIISLHNRNTALLFAGDDVLRALLFWAMFLPLGATYSLDSALNSSKEKIPKNILTGATVALVIQQCFFYMISVLFKGSSTIWFPEGTAVYYAFHFDQYAKPATAFFANAPELLLKLATYATLIVELIGPLFLFIPVYTTFFRTATVITFILLHLCFDVTFEIGLFPLLSVSSWLAYIPTPIWDYFEDKISTEERQGLTIYYDADCGFCKKVVHILRTFLILPKTPLLKAQEDESIYADMEANNSWVVLDWQGNRRFKWEALIYVISLSPVFKFLVPIMRIPVLFSLGTKFYETVATNRKMAGIFTKPLKFRPLEVKPFLLLNILTLFLITASFFWNIRSFAQLKYNRRTEQPKDAITFLYHLFNRRTINSFDWISRVTRLDQSWSIFAPAPPRDDGWHIIQGTLKDGTEVDVLYDKEGPVNWEKPSIKDRNKLYKNMQWRTYFINLNRSIGDTLYPYYANYLCRNWNANNQGEKQLDKFTIYFMDERTVPPGEEQKVEKKTDWEQDCSPKKE